MGGGCGRFAYFDVVHHLVHLVLLCAGKVCLELWACPLSITFDVVNHLICGCSPHDNPSYLCAGDWGLWARNTFDIHHLFVECGLHDKCKPSVGFCACALGRSYGCLYDLWFLLFPEWKRRASWLSKQLIAIETNVSMKFGDCGNSRARTVPLVYRQCSSHCPLELWSNLHSSSYW